MPQYTHSTHFNQIGSVYNDFKVINVKEIPELQCTLIELIHEPSGAMVMNISNDDPENLFNLAFRTIPSNSNGVAHILEHTVLCGSENFPVKDPFFAMSRRSLNTFMNALTGSDFTCYPAASQVKKDFYNLLEVYLDAVFKPKIDEFSFLQEGHRLEFSQSDNPDSPLEFKGIVFNEMKGALSSPSERLLESLNEALFPNITYGFNSGGDPKVIPQLTYEQLKAFYQTHYHPSRCLFFFYGNLPLEGHLDFIKHKTLQYAEKLPPLPRIPKQLRYTKPVTKHLSYPIAPEEDIKDQTLIAFGWLTCDILNQQEILALNVIDIFLMDTDASPLKMALLKSGYCKQASSFLDEDISEVPFIISLKGCNPGYLEKIEETIKTTLKEVVKNKIPLEAVETAMHQLELDRSEITGNHTPFGLALFMRSALLKQHGGDPVDGLRIHSLFDQLRKKLLENPSYLEDLIQHYLLDNTHFVKIEMVPDKELGPKEAAEEKALLAEIKSKLKPEEVKHLIDRSQELLRFQERQSEEDQNILPTVTIDDIPAIGRDFPLIREKMGNIELFHHDCFTNQIMYADLVCPIPNLSEEELPIARLFTILLPQLGCGGRDYKDTLDFIQSNTGGIGASMALNLQIDNPNQFVPTFHLKGKALHRKVSKLFPLMSEFAVSLDLTDRDRIKEVILKHYTGLQSTLNQSSIRYALGLSASQLSISGKISQYWTGLDYYWKIKEIAQQYDKHETWLLEKLNELKQKLLCNEGMHLVLSADKAMVDECKRHQFFGLTHLQTKPFQKWIPRYDLESIESQGRITSSPIAFTGKVFPTIPYVHPDSPALSIAAFLFENLVLHPQIREKGGAYGGGATSNALSANFYFFAHRDPHIASTLNAFQMAVDEIARGEFDLSDIEEAKLEMIQGLDSPVAPGSRAELAYVWYLTGRTKEVRLNYRQRLLKLSKRDIIEAIKYHIIPNIAKGATVTFANKDLLERENKILLAQGKTPLVLKTI